MQHATIMSNTIIDTEYYTREINKDGFANTKYKLEKLKELFVGKYLFHQMKEKVFENGSYKSRIVFTTKEKILDIEEQNILDWHIVTDDGYYYVHKSEWETIIRTRTFRGYFKIINEQEQ